MDTYTRVCGCGCVWAVGTLSEGIREGVVLGEGHSFHSPHPCLLPSQSVVSTARSAKWPLVFVDKVCSGLDDDVNIRHDHA